MRSLLVMAFAAHLLSSCAKSEETGDSIKRSLRAPKGAEGTVIDSSARPGEVTSSLEAPEQVQSGDSVPFVIRLRNSGAQAADLYLRGREIAFDVVLADSSGTEIWTRLHDQIVQAVIRIVQLEPGKSIELRHVWNQLDNSGRQVRSGDYVVRGLVLTDGVPIRTPERRLRILP
jgi:hypothetical protein